VLYVSLSGHSLRLSIIGFLYLLPLARF
jgi:hypothetical protein